MALPNKVLPGFSAALYCQPGATPTALTTAQLDGLTYAQLAALTPAQLQVLDQTQVESLTAAQVQSGGTTITLTGTTHDSDLATWLATAATH